MEKHYFGDDVPSDEVKAPSTDKVTMASVRRICNEMAILADIEPRPNKEVVVRVRDNMGTTMFFATGKDDNFWLKQKCYKQERRGDTTFYYLKLDE